MTYQTNETGRNNWRRNILQILAHLDTSLISRQSSVRSAQQDIIRTSWTSCPAKPCGFGFYQNQAGKQSCVQCTHGKTTKTIIAASSSLCQGINSCVHFLRKLLSADFLKKNGLYCFHLHRFVNDWFSDNIVFRRVGFSIYLFTYFLFLLQANFQQNGPYFVHLWWFDFMGWFAKNRSILFPPLSFFSVYV